MESRIKFYNNLSSYGRYSKVQLLKKLDLEEIFELSRPHIKYNSSHKLALRGTPGSSGISVGELVFRPLGLGKKKNKILLTKNISQQDFVTIGKAAGIIVINGGPTSPGILLARSLGIPVVIIGREFTINKDMLQSSDNKIIFKQGDSVVLNAINGEIIKAKAKMKKNPMEKILLKLINALNAGPTDESQVLSFAITPEQTKKLKNMGIGLAIRGEEILSHSPQALNLFRKFILEKDEAATQKILEKLLVLQIKYYKSLFLQNAPCPCIIRLFDPPFAEFLPSLEELNSQLYELRLKHVHAKSEKGKNLITARIVKQETLINKIRALTEENKMLGHRGSRIAITNPEIYETQLQAIFTALVELRNEGIDCEPNITIPMIIDPQEAKIIKRLVTTVAKNVYSQRKIKFHYKLGVAIETPRAVFMAKPLARENDFFSFGTNDLTQLITGISRTDYSGFLQQYKDKGILKDNPFLRLDPIVAEFIKQTVRAARSMKKLDFYLAIHDFRDIKIAKKIFSNNFKIVCPPKIAPIVKLALLKA